MMNGMGGFGMGFGWIFWIAILAVIIWAVIRLANASQNRDVYPGGRSEDALEVLKRRYANGEISREEFERMKRDLL